MAESPLHIVAVSPSNGSKKPIPSRLTRRKEIQAKFERLWLLNPEQFNPLRNCMQKERLRRTWNLLSTHTDFKMKKAVDLGCAEGVFTRKLRDAGCAVVGVDIAENALKELKKHDMKDIEAKHTAVPETDLEDHVYDIVVCTEVIAYLNSSDYRLFFSELARLVKPDGIVVCSTAVDIYTDGAIQRLLDLAMTEFDILDSKLSYYSLHIKLKNFFESPQRFLDGAKDPKVRKEAVQKRMGFNRLWYKLNTSYYLIWVWILLNAVARPINQLIQRSQRLLAWTESICEFTAHEKGISHFIFVAKLRPLQEIDPNEIPIERPHKREVWE